MGKFNKSSKFSGGNKFGGRDSGGRGFGGGDRERTQMHDAVCDECGKKCEVPFKPTGDKPIYCSSCFENRGGRSGGEERGGRREERNSFGGDRNRSSGFKDRQMFSATCSGCGNKCEVPFRPTGDKPVYCNDCFGKNKGGSDNTPSNRGGNDGQLKSQLDALNIKLDKILKILEGSSDKKIEPKAPVGAPRRDVGTPEKKAEAKRDAEIVKEIKEELKQEAKKEKTVKIKKPVKKKATVKKKK